MAIPEENLLNHAGQGEQGGQGGQGDRGDTQRHATVGTVGPDSAKIGAASDMQPWECNQLWHSGRKWGRRGRPPINKTFRLAIRGFLESEAYILNVRERILKGKAPHLEQLLYAYAYGSPPKTIRVEGQPGPVINLLIRGQNGVDTDPLAVESRERKALADQIVEVSADDAPEYVELTPPDEPASGSGNGRGR